MSVIHKVRGIIGRLTGAERAFRGTRLIGVMFQGSSVIQWVPCTMLEPAAGPTLVPDTYTRDRAMAMDMAADMGVELAPCTM